MKRLFVLLLVSTLCITVFGTTGLAAETKQPVEEMNGGVIASVSSDTVVQSGTCGENLTWILDNNGTLTISGSGSMEDYFWDNPWYGYKDEINKIIIREGVTSIGNCAFIDSSNLKTISISNTVKSIGYDAFYYCINLKAVSIPGSVEEIKQHAFDGCSGLETLNISDGVTSIYDQAFRECSCLQSLRIPQSIEKIETGAFEGCDVKSIVVDENNKIYDSRNNCNAIIESGSNTLIKGCQNTSIPNTVESIGNSAFRFCENLVNINIPESVTRIGWDAFGGCSSLEGIIIPDGVTSIGPGAFSKCSSLTYITIPANVNTIGGSAFSECSNLKKIDIPDQIHTIEIGTFNGCSSLAEITIPDAVTSIGEYAFSECSSLSKIIIPNNVTSIGDNAFYNCNLLKEVVLSEKLESIGVYAFSGCKNLQSLIIPASVVSIGQNIVYECDNLMTLRVEEGNTVYDSRDNCNAVVETQSNKLIAVTKNTVVSDFPAEDLRFSFEKSTLTISGTGEVKKDQAWQMLSNLTTKVDLSSGITEIGNSAFSGWPNIEEISIPDTVTSIANNAFYLYVEGDSPEPYNVKIIAGVSGSEAERYAYQKNIPFRAAGTNKLYGKKSQMEWVLDRDTGVLTCSGTGYINTDGITRSWYELFSGVNELVIEPGITGVAYRGFSGIRNMKKVTIPATVDYLGYDCFRSSSDTLQNITFLGKAPSNLNTVDSIRLIDERDFPVYIIYNNDASWTENVKRNFGSNVIWLADHTHIYQPETYQWDGENQTCSAFFKCSICGETLEKACQVTSEYEAGTCNEPGVTHYLASVTIDGHTYQDGKDVYDENATGHAFEVKESVEPTCTQNGYTVYECPKCGNTYKNEVPAAGHDWDEGTMVEPTCSEQGSITYTCRTCGEKYQDPESFTNRFAHQYTGEITKPATTLEAGIMTYTCTSCGDSYTAEIEPVKVEGSCGENAYWVINGDQMTISGTGDMEAFQIASTPVLYTSSAEDQAEEDQAADDGVAAFFSDVRRIVVEDGITSISDNAFKECTNLETIMLPESLTAIGENALRGTAITSVRIPDQVLSIGAGAFSGCANLSDVAIGTSVETISTGAFEGCDSLKTVVIPETVSTIEENAFTNITLRSSLVSAASSYAENLDGVSFEETDSCISGHTWETTQVEPKCSQKGYQLHTCIDCGMSYTTDEVMENKSIHTWDQGTVTKEASCTASGTIEYVCTDCGSTYEVAIPQKAHHWDEGVVTEPGCETDGYTTVTCTDCDAKYQTDYVPALGHGWDTGEVTTKATCTEDGEKIYSCNRCGETKTEVILAAGHALKKINAKASTYTKAGNITYYCCYNCGKFYSDAEGTKEIKLSDTIIKANANNVKNKWFKEDGEWHYLNRKGQLAVNEWAKDGTGWCWMDANGKITRNKWIKSGGYWYYLKSSGYMATNEWMKDSKGWCYLGSNGKMVTNGWAKDSKGWCWMGSDGYWVSNKWIQSGGQWYYIKANHYMAVNEWTKDSGGWMYMDANGRITKSKWVKSGGSWYYLKANGYMATGTQKIGGKTYKFDSAGRWVS